MTDRARFAEINIKLLKIANSDHPLPIRSALLGMEIDMLESELLRDLLRVSMLMHATANRMHEAAAGKEINLAQLESLDASLNNRTT